MGEKTKHTIVNTAECKQKSNKDMNQVTDLANEWSHFCRNSETHKKTLNFRHPDLQLN